MGLFCTSVFVAGAGLLSWGAGGYFVYPVSDALHFVGVLLMGAGVLILVLEGDDD